MDVIQMAICNNRHMTGRKELQNQLWTDFENECGGKKIFLFGLGVGADYFFGNYEREVNLCGVIDNDAKKQGLYLKEFFAEDLSDTYKSLLVYGAEVLKKYTAEEVVVLITSLVYYEQIFEQLQSMGIVHIYSLLNMEANRRASVEQNDTTETEERVQGNKIVKHKIVFYTMGGYSGHGKYIVEKILEKRDDLDIVWVVNNMSVEVPKGIRLVYSKNIRKYTYEMNTAKMWIFDDMVPLYIDKKAEQIYVQIKHWSSVTLKTFGLDLSSYRKEDISTKMNLHNGEMMDYVMVGSAFDERTCRQGFGFEGEVFYAGSPRSDILFHANEVRKKIYESYHIEDAYHTLLFAPTFRCEKNSVFKPEVGTVNIDFGKVKKALENKFGGAWEILLRLHPLVAAESSKIEKPEYVVDVSDYADSQELVAVSDALITDYSSIMFEPAFVKKPVFLFAPDRKEYINGERELLIPYDTLPFTIAESNDELVENIRQFEQEEYEQKVESFMNEYGVHEDGLASERAAEFIIQLIDKE